MAYHAKKKRTRARKHTLRSRRRTRRRGGEHDIDYVKTQLRYLRSFFAPFSNDEVEVSKQDLKTYADILKDLSDNHEEWIAVIRAAAGHQMDEKSKKGNIALIKKVLAGKYVAERLR